MKNVIVIGAGPAGLTAAINASKKNNVTIIDQNNKIGKKLLITGNGKCNYWNKNQDIENYNSSSDLSDLITNENLSRAFEFTKEIGIIPYIKNDCFYPTTNQSISVVSAFLKKLEDDGFIRREVNPDNRRKYMLKTTSKGDELVPKVRQISKDWEKEVGITEDDREVIERIKEIAINGMKLVDDL